MTDWCEWSGKRSSGHAAYTEKCPGCDLEVELRGGIMGPEYVNHYKPKYRAQVEGVSGWVDGGLFADKTDAQADAERLAGIYDATTRVIPQPEPREFRDHDRSTT